MCLINKEFLSSRSLKEEEDFIDVTLSCEEQQYSAHKVVFPNNDDILISTINDQYKVNDNNVINNKVVLSACSPYFRKLLKVKMSKSTQNAANISIIYRGKKSAWLPTTGLKIIPYLQKLFFLPNPKVFSTYRYCFFCQREI